MANNTIDTLVIDVSARAAGAAQGIDLLAASLERLKEAIRGNTGANLLKLATNIERLKASLGGLNVSGAQLDGLSTGLSAVSAATGDAKNGVQAVNEATKETGASTKAAASGLDRVGESARRAGDSARSASRGGFSQLLRDVMRIAKYRAIRTALKAVTSGIREGMQNLYQYSAAMRSTDSANFKNTMDGYATSFLYLKNSVGAAVAPLVQAFLPVIKQIVSWVVAAANAVNQLIAALQGKSVYTRATEATTEYASATGKAGKAAKALQNILMGFDEINLIETPKDSGGGGGGASTPDYSKMFEEAQIAPIFKEISDIIKDMIPLIETAGIALLAAFGATALINALSKLASLIGADGIVKALGVLKQAVFGFGAGFLSGMFIGGLTAVLDLQDGILDFSQYVGVALVGIGALITAFATTVGGVFFGIGLMFGTAYAQGVAYRQFIEKEMEANNKAYQESLKLAEKTKKAIEKSTSAIDDMREAISAYEGVEAEFAMIRDIVDRIYKISEKPFKTPSDIEELQAAINLINSKNIEGLELHFDEVTGSVKESKEEVYKLIGALEEQAKANARLDVLTKAWAAYYEASAAAASAQEEYNYNLTEYKKAADAAAKANDEFQKAQLSHADNTGELGRRYTELSTQAGVWKTRLNESGKSLKTANGQFEEAEKVLRSYGQETESVSKTVDSAISTIRKSYSKAETSSYGFAKRFGTDLDEMKRSALSKSPKIGEAVVNGITYSLNAGQLATYNSMLLLGYSGEEAIAKAWEINSPSKVMMRMAGYAVLGLTSGIDAGVSDVRTSINGIATAASDTMKGNTTSSIWSVYGKNMMVDIEKGIKGNVGLIVGATKKVAEAASQGLGTYSGYVRWQKEGKYILTQMQSSFIQYGSIVSNAFAKNVANPIADIMNLLIKRIIGRWNSMLQEFKNSGARLNSNGSISITTAKSYNVGSIQKFASGGFAGPGQLFISRESGPELVASASGGGTNVMNNDQIVKSVSDGVYRAMMDTGFVGYLSDIASNTEGGTAPVFAPSAEAGRWISRSSKMYAAQGGR